MVSLSEAQKQASQAKQQISFAQQQLSSQLQQTQQQQFPRRSLAFQQEVIRKQPRKFAGKTESLKSEFETEKRKTISKIKGEQEKVKKAEQQVKGYEQQVAKTIQQQQAYDYLKKVASKNLGEVSSKEAKLIRQKFESAGFSPSEIKKVINQYEDIRKRQRGARTTTGGYFIDPETGLGVSSQYDLSKRGYYKVGDVGTDIGEIKRKTFEVQLLRLSGLPAQGTFFRLGEGTFTGTPQIGDVPIGGTARGVQVGKFEPFIEERKIDTFTPKGTKEQILETQTYYVNPLTGEQRKTTPQERKEYEEFIQAGSYEETALSPTPTKFERQVGEFKGKIGERIFDSDVTSFGITTFDLAFGEKGRESFRLGGKSQLGLFFNRLGNIFSPSLSFFPTLSFDPTGGKLTPGSISVSKAIDVVETKAWNFSPITGIPVSAGRLFIPETPGELALDFFGGKAFLKAGKWTKRGISSVFGGFGAYQFLKAKTPAEKTRALTMFGLGGWGAFEGFRYKGAKPKTRLELPEYDSKIIRARERPSVIIQEEGTGRVLFEIGKNDKLGLLPGGAIDKGEVPIQALKREVLEELFGFDPKKLKGVPEEKLDIFLKERGLDKPFKFVEDIQFGREKFNLYKTEVPSLKELPYKLQSKEIEKLEFVLPEDIMGYKGRTYKDFTGKKIGKDIFRYEDIYSVSRSFELEKFKKLSPKQKIKFEKQGEKFIRDAFGLTRLREFKKLRGTEGIGFEGYLSKKGMTLRSVVIKESQKKGFLSPGDLFKRESFDIRGRKIFPERVKKPTIRKPSSYVDWIRGRKPGQFKKGFKKLGEADIRIELASGYDIDVGELLKLRGEKGIFVSGSPYPAYTESQLGFLGIKKEDKIFDLSEKRISQLIKSGEGLSSKIFEVRPVATRAEKGFKGMYFQPPTKAGIFGEGYLGASYTGVLGIEKESLGFTFKKIKPTIYRFEGVGGKDLIFTKKALAGVEAELGATPGTLFGITRTKWFQLQGKRVRKKYIDIVSPGTPGAKPFSDIYSDLGKEFSEYQSLLGKKYVSPYQGASFLTGGDVFGFKKEYKKYKISEYNLPSLFGESTLKPFKENGKRYSTKYKYKPSEIGISFKEKDFIEKPKYYKKYKYYSTPKYPLQEYTPFYYEPSKQQPSKIIPTPDRFKKSKVQPLIVDLRKSIMQPSRYTPSLTGLTFGFTAKEKPKGFVGGESFGIRPIIISSNKKKRKSIFGF